MEKINVPNIKKHFFIFLVSLISFLYTSQASEKKVKPSHSITEESETKSYSVNKILTLQINSSINPATLNYLKSGFEHAHKDRFNLIILKMNTPGGLVTTTKDILTLFGKSEIPVTVWVTPEGASATSAGAIISVGAHFLFMSPGTNIGAATPVTLGGQDEKSPSPDEMPWKKLLPKEPKKKKGKQDSTKPSQIETAEESDEQESTITPKSDMKRKAVNDLVALVKSLAQTRGRNGHLFADMISKASSFEAQTALEKNLIDGISHTLEDILTKVNNREIYVKGKKLHLKVQDSYKIIQKDMDVGQQILDIFANPSLAYILFLIGAALIYLELQAPGGMIAGSIGVFFLILAGIGFQVLPLNFGALALIILSFVLFVLEAYIVSYGILTLSGMTALLFGSLFLFRSDNSFMEFQTSIVYSAVAAIGAFVGLIAYYWVWDASKHKGKEISKEDPHSIVGRTGTITSNGPTHSVHDQHFYNIKVRGEFWNAWSNENLSQNDPIIITALDNKKLLVQIKKD